LNLELEDRSMEPLSRRSFAKVAAAGVATAASASRVWGANEQVRLGFIGVGNRGDQMLDAFLPHKDCKVVAVSDLHAGYMAFAARKAGGAVQQHADFRELLDRKDVDAVVISTPDHWHALMTIAACAAGKDVYVEKPLSLCIAEGRAMVSAARKHDRIVQVGIQRRSSDFCREAAEIVRGGGIGKVTVVRCFHIQNEWPRGIGRPDDGEPPAEFNWDAWLGPAPQQPYNVNKTFYRFRWFYNFSGGQLTNMGVHYLDVIHAALGHDAPEAVTAMGGKYADFDNRDIPDTLEVLWRYPGGTLVSFSQYNATSAPASAKACEIEFRGTLGTLYLHGSGYEIVPEIVTPNEFAARTPLDRALDRNWRSGAKARIEPKQGRGHQDTAVHARDFLDSIRSRKLPRGDVEVGHRSTSATLVANVAARLSAYLEWDGKAERFTNNEAANKMLRYEYRSPHVFPESA
jgi:predicted dehydrogenase